MPFFKSRPIGPSTGSYATQPPTTARQPSDAKPGSAGRCGNPGHSYGGVISIHIVAVQLV